MSKGNLTGMIIINRLDSCPHLVYGFAIMAAMQQQILNVLVVLEVVVVVTMHDGCGCVPGSALP